MNKSSYQKRIEEKLAALSIAVDARTIVKLRLRADTGNPLNSTISGDSQWKVVHVHRGRRKCELCGHNPILNIFTIKSIVNGKTLEIGSKCAKNYLDADLVDGLCRIYNLEYRKIVNPIKFEDAIEVLEWATENRRATYQNSSLAFWCRNLICSGSPQSVLYKINGGKNIGKKEKAVIEFWTYVKDTDPEVLEALNVIFLAYRVRRRDIQIEKYRIRREASERREAIRQLGRFFSQLPELVIPELVAGLRRQCGVTEKATPQDLFNTLYNQSLCYKSQRFVNSVYAYWKRNHTVSDKQYAVLQKIAAENGTQ